MPLTSQDDDVAVRAKQDGSPVTAADLASNDILRAACLAVFPAMPVPAKKTAVSSRPARTQIPLS
ncbi:MAG: hypothetical protein ACJ8EW_01015 [Rhizobium sp.]|uniref:hypothetical protein n=1 Tax=Rhizobium TaxID=379 RepID=UPI00035F889C|nr:hypothetical protein [Rhizobium leguminosarum]UWM84161.1 hypothetical protein N2A41_22765 [Rhizobium leguminosarum bv. viciae]